MLSTLARYKRQIKATLIRCFPRTTEYLRAHDPSPKAAPKAAKPRKKAAQGAKAAGKPSATRQSRANTAKANKAVYPSAQLKISAAQISAMREQVAKAVEARLIGAPSDEQWAMILSRAPLTRVFAGAGSGKSSTLVLRVVFMLCHLKITPEQLTVISFTNAACAELRERLNKLLNFWRYSPDASQCVRTFHSALTQMARETGACPEWFEHIGATKDADNPLTSGPLNPKQNKLLQSAYQNAYQNDASFRACILRLLDLPADAPTDQAPTQLFRLAGEYSPRPLFEHLYQQLSFAQALGLNLPALAPQSLNCSLREQDFISALIGFDSAFKQVLTEHNLSSFNHAFAELSSALATGKSSAPSALSHLLIDEFQDISPQIVQWIRAAQLQLSSRGESISLMAIGDDWQSIYGWRGSSPELFVNFAQHFPCRTAKGCATLYLTTNYRSIKPVIDDAAKLLRAVKHKQDKTCTAAKTAHAGDHGVNVQANFDLSRDLESLLACIKTQCAHAATRQSAERTAVMVLSRRNEPLKILRPHLAKQASVQSLSIHRAKGLQAEVAIILDDCQMPDSHPVRNALYQASGLFSSSYDQAMQDEALRLGYVAVTRGVSRVLWFTRKTQGASALLAG